MYIGPWQEYSLSKGKQTQKVQNDVRKEIENVLLQTLDPNAAGAALKAMEQYFQQHPAQTQGNHNSSAQPLSTSSFQPDFQSLDWGQHVAARPLRPNLPKGNRSTPRNQLNRSRLPPLDTTNIKYEDSISDKGSETPIESLTVASIMRVVNSAREMKKRDPSPLSVRSSKSEPVQPSNRLPKLSTSQKISSNNSPRTTVSVESESTKATPTLASYDQNALVNFLRMERNQKAKEDIYKLTGWDKQIQKPKLKPLQSTQDQKIHQINQMKDLYLLEQQKQMQPKKVVLEPLQDYANQGNSKIVAPHAKVFDDPVLNGPNTNMSTNYVISEHPIITDMEITESDIMKISKYFQNAGNSNLVNLGSNVEKKASNSSSSFQPVNRKEEFIIPSSKSTKAPPFNDEEDDGVNIATLKSNSSKQQLPHQLSSNPSSVLNSPNGKYSSDFYSGGIDNLLKWTKELDLSDL